MYPTCRHMDLHHPTGGYIPTFLAHPGVDSSKQSEACNPWASSPNNYAFPVSGYGCNGYGDYPVHHGSYFPYTYAAPGQFFCCGHQPHPGTFGAPYYPPPPYYGMELNHDGYRKEGGLNHEVRHCCGCPNHTHSKKSPQGVKVEELEPDTKGKQVDSYPIVWIPGEFMNNRNRVQQADQSRGGIEASRNSDVHEQNKLSKRQPNGWFPLDMNHLASLFGNGEKKSLRHHDGDKEFQVPFVWMPSRQEKEHSYKGTNEKSNDPLHLVEKTDPLSKIFQPEYLGVKNSADKPPEVKEDRSRCQGGSGEKEKHEKTIPVVEVKPCKDYENSEDKVGCNRIGSSARAKEDVKSKITDMNRQSSSPPKTAKLSPVCLRVDPAPKKKNGGSRSPSPRGSKGKSLEISQDSCKTTAVTDIKVKDHENSLAVGNTPTKETKEERNVEDNTDRLLQPASDINVSQTHEIAIMSETGEFRHQGNLRNESTMVTKEPSDLVTLTNGGQMAGVKRLSKEKVATLIQSVYRGYYVRKWEPLKKLKQIAGVREQLTGVRNGIHALETSTDYDEKQKVAMGEMIMNLLLKLDSIQGLHPNVRDIRKSLAKELVTLQEHLDSLEIKKREVSKPSGGNHIGNCASEILGENPCINREDDDCYASTPTAVTKEAVASEAVGSSSRHEPDLVSSDGDMSSKVDERTEDSVLTNVGVEQLEEVGAAVPQVVGSDPEGKPILTGVAMQINGSTNDDVLKGSAPEILSCEAYVPGEVERPCEEKWNLGCEDRHETYVGLGVTGGERSVKPEEQSNESFGDEVREKKVNTDVPAGETTEGVVGTEELCDFQDVPQERYASGSVVLKSADELAIQKEPSTMEEVADNGAAEPIVEINVGAIQGVLNGCESSLPKDQSSQSEAAVDSVTDEGDTQHIRPQQEEYEKSNQGEEQTGEMTDGITEADPVSSSQATKEILLPDKKASQLEEDIAATEVAELDLDLDRETKGDEKSDNVQKPRSLGNEDENIEAQKKRRVQEDNERRMKEMMEKLVEAGTVQMEVISKLSSRVEDLEKRLCNNKSTRRSRGRCRSAKKKDASPAA